MASGSSFEELERRLCTHGQRRREEALRRIAICALPCTSNYEFPSCFSRQTLRTIAWKEDLVLYTDDLFAMRDEELAEFIARNRHSSRDDVIDFVTYAGHEALELLRSICYAGAVCA